MGFTDLPSFDPVEPKTPKFWWDSPPRTLEGMLHILELRCHKLQEFDEEGIALREILEKVEEIYAETTKEIENQYRIAFFKPSYEQSLLLNAWIWGIDFVVCFAANRIGKTTALGVINPCLYIFPNNPEWEMFACSLTPDPATGGKTYIPNPHDGQGFYVDIHGREVQLISRPDIRELEKIRQVLKDHPELIGDPTKSHFDPANADKLATLQKMIPEAYQGAWPRPPIHEGGTIWLGAPDISFHRDIILKEWKRWLPVRSIAHWSDSEQVFYITTAEETNPNPTVWNFICKSYESEDTKWSGSAVRAIILTEGLDQTTLNEVKQRIQVNGFASWDYTPYEARNVGAKTALAHKVFKGLEQLPLRAHIFTRFSARLAPHHILPESKRDDLIRMWDGKKEGEARLDGVFYSSSPLVLSRLDRGFHTVPWTKEELFKRYPTGQIYRSIDPGYDHPTVCCWGLLVPGDIWFFFRYYVKRQTTISERCADIIKLSCNVAKKEIYGPGKTDYYLVETNPNPGSEVIVATVADYHMFEIDQVTGRCVSINYNQEGLVLLESTHMGPEDRAMELDKLLDKSPYHTHPVTGHTPGSRAFFLINETGVDTALSQMEGLFWERLASGPNKGAEKDKVPIHGDDELDATCQLAAGPYRWSSYQPPRRNTITANTQRIGNATFGIEENLTPAHV